MIMLLLAVKLIDQIYFCHNKHYVINMSYPKTQSILQSISIKFYELLSKIKHLRQ